MADTDYTMTIFTIAYWLVSAKPKYTDLWYIVEDPNHNTVVK